MGISAIRFWSKAAVSTVLLASAVAQAQTPPFSKPEEAVAYRKGVFNVMERHFSRLNNMALGRVPFDQATAVFDARMVDLLAQLPFKAFVPGSEQVGNTRANESVWKATPRFNEDAANFAQKAAGLPAAAAAGNLDALKKAMIDNGSSCRKCHDQFRIR